MNKITKVVWVREDAVDVFFDGLQEPFNYREFQNGPVKDGLIHLEVLIDQQVEAVERALLPVVLIPEPEELYPGERDDRRRSHAVDKAVLAADRIILDASDGSVEETDWLTSALALKFAEKVQMANEARLRRTQMLTLAAES